MRIEVLGDGGRRCQRLYENVRQAIQESGLRAVLVLVNSAERFAHYGIYALPGLVIDGEVKAAGETLSVATVKVLLRQEAGGRQER